MQFVAKKKHLLEELSLVQGVVEKRSTRPILSNALLESDDKGVAVYATDLEVGLSAHFQADVGRSGAITAPAKKLTDIVRLLPDSPDVSIEVLDNHFLKIVCGKIEYKLAGAPKEDYPTLPQAADGDGIEIPAQIFKTMINQTIYAITVEETRYALNGAQIAFDGETIRMVTTDAHRLAYVSLPFDNYSGKLQEILIPRKTVSELRMLIDDRLDSIVFTHTENHLFFRVGSRILDSRVLEGQFPSYEKVLPQDNDKTVVVNKTVFSDAIDRVALLSHETSKAIRLSLSSGIMLISSNNPEVGEAKEEIEVDYDGPSFEVGFNSKYLSDFISTVSSDEVIMELKDEAAAGLMKPSGDEQGSYKYVIMPMRI